MPRRVPEWEMRQKAGLGLEAWTRWVQRDLAQALKAEGFTSDDYKVTFRHEGGGFPVVVHHIREGFLITWTNLDGRENARDTIRLPREVEVPYVVDIARGLVWVCSNRAKEDPDGQP